MGPIYGWRLPFLVISVPAIVCALVVYLTVQDPERGKMEQYHLYTQMDGEDRGQSDQTGLALVPMSSRSSLVNSNLDEKIKTEAPVGRDYSIENVMNGASERRVGFIYHLQSSINLLSIKTLRLTLLQAAPGCVPWGIVNVFLNDYLSENCGLSVQAATTILMFFSVGYGFGLVMGGVGGKLLYKIDIRLPALLAGGSAIIGCFPFWFLLNSVDSSTPFLVAATSAIVAGLGSAPTGPIIKTTLTNVTLPRDRGKAFALFNLFDDFGKGLGPFFVSLLIVKFGGRQSAFNAGIFGWVLCGMANIAIFFTVEHDEYSVQSTLAAQMPSVKQSSIGKPE
mmetsp:Transcript_23591/g.55902  ORF Transcript_23591/g.55902 Transcript_23591/m.55902 type:complete len:337 (+) Transcript_23591:742-1752(+)